MANPERQLRKVLSRMELETSDVDEATDLLRKLPSDYRSKFLAVAATNGHEEVTDLWLPR